MTQQKADPLVLRMNLKELTIVEVARLLKREGVLREGHFAMPECHSSTRLEWPRIAENPKNSERIGQELGRLSVDDGAEVVLSSVDGWSMLLAEPAARYLKVPIVFAGTDKNGHPAQLREGFDLYSGKRVLIIHDILASVYDVNLLKDIILKKRARCVGIALFATYTEEIQQQLKEIIPNTHILVELSASIYPIGNNCPLCDDHVPLTEY